MIIDVRSKILDVAANAIELAKSRFTRLFFG
jgi:hypothetical protein